MKSLKFTVIIIIALICNFETCNAQNEYKTTNKTFQTFLDKFQTITPPFNYKKVKHKMGYLTKEEALNFLQKRESDLYYMEMEFGLETEEISYTKTSNYPGFDFKYQINDSVLVVCTRESIRGGAVDTVMSCLYLFNSDGKIIDKGLIINGWYSESDYIGTQFSCVFLNKNQIRVYYYESVMDEEIYDEGFKTLSYYLEYQISENGIFTLKNKSDTTYLKKSPDFYGEYNPKNEDDPMNKYNF